MLELKVPEEVLVDEDDRKFYPNMYKLYFKEREKLEGSLEANLKAFRKFVEENTFLWGVGYDPDRAEEFYDAVLPVVDEEGRVYGVEHVTQTLSDYLPLHIREKPIFDFKSAMLFADGLAVYFPPEEYRERWSIMEEFFERECLWGTEDVLPVYTKKKLRLYTSVKVTKDGVIEYTGVLTPMCLNKEFDYDPRWSPNPNEYSIYTDFDDFLQWNRIQLLYYTGMIDREDFIKLFVHWNLMWSLFKPVDYPLGRNGWKKFIDNVLVPAHDQLKESGKAVVELEDVRDMGCILQNPHYKVEITKERKIPARVVLYDYEKLEVFPLPSRAVVWDEDNPVSYPLPEEVRALMLDLNIIEMDRIETGIKEFGMNKKGTRFYGDYEASLFWMELREKFIPSFWEEWWKKMMEVAKG